MTMRIKLFILGGATLLLLSVALFFGLSRGSRAIETQPESRTLPKIAQNATPADQQMAIAQRLVESEPKSPEGYNQLGAAFLQKTRETGDFGFIRRAEAAAERSAAVAPDNYGALRLRAKLAAANHRFPEALKLAHLAIEQSPRDLDMYGIMTDAQVELGNYREAIESAEAMVKIRPYAPSYSRISYLRSLYGDTAGAIAAMRMAEQSAGDPESLAWCAVHLGDELMNAGQRVEGECEYDRALYAFPNYHFALAGKARARIAAGDLNAAVEFYRRAQERVPLPDVAIALGNLYARLGRNDEAQKQYDFVEFIERSGTAGAGTYSRQIAVFWADRGLPGARQARPRDAVSHSGACDQSDV